MDRPRRPANPLIINRFGHDLPSGIGTAIAGRSGTGDTVVDGVRKRNSEMPEREPAAARPRHQAIADEPTSDIPGDRYPVGTMMPTEHVLCARFDARRYTVREALRRLREMGLVRVRRGSGTVAVDKSVAAMLRCDPGTEWSFLSGVRMRETSETPICWTNFHLVPPPFLPT